MTNHELRELLLHYEELSPEERARADAVLAERPELRRVLERLRDAERSAPRGQMRSLEARDLDADPELAGEASASLAALTSRLGLDEAERSRETSSVATSLREPAVGSWRARLARLLPGRMPLAVAASALAVLSLVILRGGSPPAFRVAEVMAPPGERGGTPAVESGVWHTGDAFTLRIVPARAAHLVVLHVGPTGDVQLLEPASPHDAPRSMEAGEEVLVPDPIAGETWRFEGEPGPETFLVVASDSPAPPIAEVLARLPGATAGRTTRIERLVDALEGSLGPTRRLDVTHRP